MIGVVNSVAFENCLQAQFYICAICSVLITYMDYFHDGVNLLRSCKAAYLLMVINAAVNAANSTPACLPGQHATAAYVTNCSARMQHGLCGR